MSEPITIEEVAEYFEQNFASAMAWDFMPERKREVAAFLRSQAETIKAQGEEIESLKKYFFMHENCRLGTGLCKRATENFAALSVAVERIEQLKQERDEALEVLETLRQWADAYPVSVFPEPDFKAVGAALESVGISLDSVSAANMRYVITGVKRIVDGALKSEPTEGK